MKIKSDHRYAYHRNEWAEILDIKKLEIGMPGHRKPEMRACFHIKFDNGDEDYWPIYDLDANYEFEGDIVLL